MANATPDYETCHARFPHLNPLPPAGEEANERFAYFTLHAFEFVRVISRGTDF
jgi:hypothetical protein